MRRTKQLQRVSLLVSAIVLCLCLAGTVAAQCPNCAQAAPQPGVSVQVDPSGVAVHAGRDARPIRPQVVVAQEPPNGNGNGLQIQMTPEELDDYTQFYFRTHYRPRFRVFAFMPQRYVPVRVNSPRYQLWREYHLEKLKDLRAQQYQY